MLSTIKSQLEAAPSNSKPFKAMISSSTDTVDAESTTPIHSPAPGFVPLGQMPNLNAPIPAAAPAQTTSSVLEALKAMAAKQTPAQPVPVPNNSLNALLGLQNVMPQQSAPVNQGQNVNPLTALLSGVNNAQPAQSNPLTGMFPPPPQVAPLQVGPDAQATLQLVQLMAAQGIPPDQWAAAIQVINAQGKGGMPFPAPPPLPGQNFNQPIRDNLVRSPISGRRRSRSPDHGRGRNGRNSPDNRNGGRRGNDYRQRSPVRNRREPSPENPGLPPPGDRFIEWDHNMPKESIKVLSRTLFVGGVTCSESHLKSLFAKFGVVQTCIVNVDKRHAFVKMINRKDTESARYGMEEYRDNGTQLRTKYGVGYGPRDCSDYQTGVSIIPIHRLTDADKKWMISAEYGGTGGKDIVPGMIVEEPDIEIGAGVSSKGLFLYLLTN